jgi:hypothetical protein
MVLTEGWDMPDVGCCILARPTKQIGLYLQMIGRVLRPAEGKERAIVLDHSGGVYRHGRPEDRIEWTLDVDARAVNKEQERRKRGEAMKVRECPTCQHVLTAVPCWQCGWEPKPYSRGVDFAEGELGLVEQGVAEQNQLSPNQKQEFYRELLWVEAKRRHKSGWLRIRLRKSARTSRPGPGMILTTKNRASLPLAGCATATLLMQRAGGRHEQETKRLEKSAQWRHRSPQQAQRAMGGLSYRDAAIAGLSCAVPISMPTPASH